MLGKREAASTKLTCGQSPVPAGVPIALNFANALGSPYITFFYR
jgi:hypothetical protein